VTPIYVIRHGETEWSRDHRHTGRTDLPLTGRGNEQARRLASRLRGFSFAQVLTSPQQRAIQTCALAGFGAVARVDVDLREWDCGDYEGLTLEQIHASRPGWILYRDGCPGGESPEQVAERAGRVIRRVREHIGNVLLFSSGHILRALAARWLGTEILCAKFLMLSTASVSELGYEHDRQDEPVIWLWNDTRHLGESGATPLLS